MLMIALLLQAAAPPPEVELSEGDLRQMAMIARSRRSAAVEMVKVLKPNQLEAALREALSDRTRMSYDGEGVVIEYSAPGGQLRTWHPGYRNLVGGQWGVQRFKKLVSACFRHGSAAGQATGPFEPRDCLPAEETLGAANVIREWRGDVFNLMTGRVPYVKSAMGMPNP